MIARSVLPGRWVTWNAWTGAPFHGPFAHFRCNSPTRAWEYPWAAEALGDLQHKRVLDVGGGMGGLAFVLGRVAREVVVADPDSRPTSSLPVNDAWARTWGARVTRLHGTASEAEGLFDAAACLSVIEHIAEPEERRSLVLGVFEHLRPGGRFVVTLDLHLGLAPFTDIAKEPGLRNVSVRELLDAAPFDLVFGAEQELLGMPGFDPGAIRQRAARGEFICAHGHLCSQCFVLERPVGSRPPRSIRPVQPDVHELPPPRNPSQASARSSRRAFLVLGPESTGTRFVTRLLMAAGCEGSDQHAQPFDQSFQGAGDLIVWRRSVPHGGHWPSIPELIGTLRSMDFEVFAVVTVRDHGITERSQVRDGHAPHIQFARSHLTIAWPLIFGHLSRLEVPWHIAVYESLIRGEREIDHFLSRLGLSLREKIEIVDGNEKYLAGGTNSD